MSRYKLPVVVHNNVVPIYRPKPRLAWNHPALVASRKRKAGEYRRHLVKIGVIRENLA